MIQITAFLKIEINGEKRTNEIGKSANFLL